MSQYPGGGPPYRSAQVSMPSAAQLGGEQQPAQEPSNDGSFVSALANALSRVFTPVVPPFVRFPFFPTAPWMSTNPNVGFQVRDYSTGIRSDDQDFQVNSEMSRSIRFDIPVRVIAINGAATRLSDPDSGTITEQNMNLLYLMRVEYAQGDKLHTDPRLASTVVGTAKNPGELGGHGYNVDQGGSLMVFITPLVADIRVDLTFVCLETRAPRNFAVR